MRLQRIKEAGGLMVGGTDVGEGGGGGDGRVPLSKSLSVLDMRSMAQDTIGGGAGGAAAVTTVGGTGAGVGTRAPRQIPFYDIPIATSECLIDANCLLWIKFHYIPGRLRVTHDVLVFSSVISSGADGEAGGDAYSHFQDCRDDSPFAFSIHLATVTRIERRACLSMLPKDTAEKPHVIEITTSSRSQIQSVVLSVCRNDDVFPQLLQLWAVAVRSPQFRMRRRVSRGGGDGNVMTPPALLLNEMCSVKER